MKQLCLNGQPVRECVLVSGQTLRLDVDLQSQQAVHGLTLGLMVHTAMGLDLFGTHTAMRGQPLNFQPGQTLRVSMEVDLLLGAGEYTLTLAVHDAHDFTQRVFLWAFHCVRITVVEPAASAVGAVRLPCRVHVRAIHTPNSESTLPCP
ncbi:Wzt carbohydrate-binding domain-containing protein [Tepidimonas ignava]